MQCVTVTVTSSCEAVLPQDKEEGAPPELNSLVASLHLFEACWSRNVVELA